MKDFTKKKNIEYPLVIKASAGAGSGGVALAYNERELLKYSKKYSKRIYFDYYANLWRISLIQKLKNTYRTLKKQPLVIYRKKEGKFIVQTFITNLKGDYKVLVFGNQYYVLQRMNRVGDFRASGSGRFSFPGFSEETQKILDFAKMAHDEMQQPMLSLDIAYDGKECHMIEFQAVHFGPYTLEKSSYYYEYKNLGWSQKKSTGDLEDAVVYAVNNFILGKEGHKG